ncbi:hypothetical protein MTR67_027226 [Solanum verrucosum]|uniref:Ubiquinol-cytochrome c chaperone domain-containing protein n=1 Tax=Solanum verrucosum TaxID=315347 RepID=A0AAF0R1X5_SOLVR|nr:hypothetical protein MTR67_027226 [Solanum verrucosum]
MELLKVSLLPKENKARDPLSPFLFILAMEGLNNMIKVNKGQWLDFRRGAVKISKSNHSLKVNLLLIKWMKDLEKIFYGNIVAYDAAMLPEAKQDELQNVIWRPSDVLCCRNVFSDDGTSTPSDAALLPVQASPRLHGKWVAGNPCVLYERKFILFSPSVAVNFLLAMSRYVRRESNCLSFTDKEAMFSGNFMFTSLGSTTAGTV